MKFGVKINIGTYACFANGHMCYERLAKTN